MSAPRRRDDLRDLEGYHSPQVDVAVRLNTNESPYPPPPEFFAAWTAEVNTTAAHRYPDREARALRQALADFLGQPRERVFCANGSNEVLQTILLTYGGPGRTALVFEPSYVLHAHIAHITGTGVVTGERRNDFTLDPAAAVNLVTEQEPDVVFLTTPNNPTGIVEPEETVEALVDAVARRAKPGVVVIDEAYAEFSPWTAIDLVADDRPLVVSRTSSKVWSMAAFRLGFCIAPAAVVDDLLTVVLPYNLSVPTQTAGTVALRYTGQMGDRVASIKAERDRVAAALGALDGVEAFPSGANFILFRPTAADGQAVWEALLEADVLVRNFARWPRLDNCLRVTIGLPEENDAFLAALKEVLS
ncbi:MAG TPA: histidinol-phosphate transaminase [Acidimicrobiia bacterium]|nr:histidinol-phosphate transaminase [Acidimicrobiia bacterium]